jgi:hypothetical protein
LRAASAASLGASTARASITAGDPARPVAAPGGRPPEGSSTAASPSGAGETGAATFALVARTTKSRAAAAVLLGALSAEAGRNGAPPRADVLPIEGGYRASLWPFGSREQALRTQQRLREAGLETDLVSF